MYVQLLAHDGNNGSKLGDHSDERAHNSTIAGLSVYENAKDER
jgi:hypothetical protein